MKNAMVKKLHLRLTRIFTILTSLVLACAMCVTYYLAYSQYKAGVEAYSNSFFSALSDKLKNNDEISDTWLAEQEISTVSIIHIEDNGIPLHFQGAWQPLTDRGVLIEKARHAVEENVQRQNFRFTVDGERGERYEGTAALIQSKPAGSRGILLIILRDTTMVLQQKNEMAVQYFLLWLAGSALLGLISAYLSGMALAPTKQAVDRQNEFIAAASHELRTPLSVIKASISAALEEGGWPEKARGFLQTAENEANRMTRLNDDLLLLAGSDAKVWRFSFAPMQLDTFCVELYEQFYALMKEKGRPFRLDLPADALPTIQADAERLMQLFSILLHNALEYSAPATPIRIVAVRCKASVSIMIEDHGKGVSDEEKSKIFARFYRIDKSRSDKTHFGLGLSMAKEIAEQHQAGLSVKDTPGGGATFELTFHKFISSPKL